MLVSVIMPVWGEGGHSLKRSLESVTRQTHDDLELIVLVDPTSHDADARILAILDEYRDDHRVRRVVNAHRLGFTASLNLGASVASGQVIARMDSDDESAPGRLATEIDWMMNHNADLVGSWALVIDDGGSVIGSLTPPSEFASIRKYLLLHNPFVHSSILFTRRLYETAGPYDVSYEPGEDYEFYLRAVSRGFRCVNVPSFLHFLREREGSMTRGGRWKQNRLNYIRCKAAAVTKYGYNTPLDLMFASLSIIAVFVGPRQVLSMKRAIGQYRPRQTN